MSIKLRQQEIYQKKLNKLIDIGKKLSVDVLKNEHHINVGNFFGYEEQLSEYDFVRPDEYDPLTFEIDKWKKQSQYLLEKFPLEGTVYENVFTLLTKEELAGIDIQEIVLHLEAVLEELVDGQFENLFLKVEAQSVINHLDQAYQLLDEGYHKLAGVVALCSLESFLREMSVELTDREQSDSKEADEENLGESAQSSAKKKEKTLSSLSNFLRNKGYLTKEMHKKILNWAEIRNRLVHGSSENIDVLDVKEILTSIKVFVISA